MGFKQIKGALGRAYQGIKATLEDVGIALQLDWKYLKAAYNGSYLPAMGTVSDQALEDIEDAGIGPFKRAVAYIDQTYLQGRQSAKKHLLGPLEVVIETLGGNANNSGMLHNFLYSEPEAKTRGLRQQYKNRNMSVQDHPDWADICREFDFC